MDASSSLLQSLLQTSNPDDDQGLFHTSSSTAAATDTNNNYVNDDDILLQESLANLEEALNSLAMELNEPVPVDNDVNVHEEDIAMKQSLPPGMAVDLSKEVSNATASASTIAGIASSASDRVQVQDLTSDAWAMSLANFDTLEEFLQADNDAKNDNKQSLKNKKDAEENLFANVMQYDETEVAQPFIAQPVPQPQVLGPTEEAKGRQKASPSSASSMYTGQQQQHLPQVPPSMMSHMPPVMHPMGQTQPLPGHAHQNFMPPPPHMIPQSIPNQMPMGIPMPMMQPPHIFQQQQQNLQSNSNENSKETISFEKSEFPPLGSDTSNNKKDKDAKTGANTDQSDIKVEESKEISVNAPSPGIRILFNNPAAPDVLTKLATSSVMTQKDIQFVVSAMLRSLTAENQDDFYYKQYLRKFNIHDGGIIEVDHVRREKYRENVETRSKVWQEKQQSLGRVVKTDVTRPKAMLTAPKLIKQTQEDSNTETILRANLWKARALIDTGYQSFFNLIDLSAILWKSDVTDEEKNMSKKQIRNNLIKLNASFGLMPNVSTDGMNEINEETLSLILSLPKGKELLAKSLEKGIVPHPSATKIFPYAFSIIVGNPGCTDINDAASQKETRLLQAFMALINLRQPSLSQDVFLSTLEKVISINSNVPLRELLNAPLRAEVMHALMTRGGEVCAGDQLWISAEASFLRALSSL